MNWYNRLKFAAMQKIASVTFYISGSHGIAKPIDMISFPNEFLLFINNVHGEILYSDVQIDEEGDVFAPTGDFFVFMTKENKLAEQNIDKLIQMWNKSNPEIQLKFIDVRIHENYQTKEKTPYAVISVTKNETVNRERVPELNVANDNAKQLVELLQSAGVPMEGEDHYGGSFDAMAYKRSRPLIDKQMIEIYTRPDSAHPEPGSTHQMMNDDFGGQSDDNISDDDFFGDILNENKSKGPQMFNQGLSVEQIQRYFQVLDQMVIFIESHQIPNKTIQFG